MKNSRIFLTWQPVLTDHQAFTYQALAQQAAVPVVAYVTAAEDAERKTQGWARTQVNSVEQRPIPGKGFLSYCYRQLCEYRTDIHVFASPFQQPRLILCMLLAAWLGVEFYLISEPFSPNADGYLSESSAWRGKLKAMLRPWVYRCYARLFGARLAGIFAISGLAIAQYEKAGVPSGKLFPFGYFIPAERPSPLRSALPVAAADACLKIVFVGNLIRRKGLDLLQEAVHGLSGKGYKISVDVFGPGDPSSLPADDPGIRYRGLIPFGQAQQVIARYDLLVLPSRYDGWGVVVNEALCAGVPVVCSDATGAGGVAAAFGSGLLFSVGDAASLSAVLARLVDDPGLLNAMRTATAPTAQALQPEVAASYMLDVIRAPAALKSTIRAPWCPQSA